MTARLAIAALVLGCALLIPLRLSDDVWAYAAYGALLLDGRDPWAQAWTAASLPAGDPLLATALARWQGSLPRDVYGPLFTVPCAVVVAATRNFGPAAAVASLRLFAALGLLLCVRLADARRPGLSRQLAFHPVALWAAAEGHNDTLWLALVLGAERLRGGTRFALLAAAASVKAVAAAPLAAALATLAPPARARWGLACAAVVGIAYAPLAASLRAGSDAGLGPPRLSVVHGAALAAWSASPVPGLIALLLLALGTAAIARLWSRGDRVAAAVLGGWLLYPSPEPWYVLWLLPLAFTARAGRGRTVLLAATWTIAAGYLQDAAGETALRDPAFLGGLMLAIYVLPLLIALAPAPSPAPNAAPPTPPPLVSPSPSAAPQPAATTTPLPPQPTATPTANPWSYVVRPTPGPSGAPQILEIALNNRVQHENGLLLVRVTATPDVTGVMLRAMGREIALPGAGAPGLFGAQQQLPGGMPFFFLNRNYDVDVIATTQDGRSTTATVSVRLER